MDFIDRISLIDSISNIIWKAATVAIFIGGLILQYYSNYIARNIAISVVVLGLSILVFILPEVWRYIRGYETVNKKSNSLLVIDHAEINTVIGKRHRSHTRKYTVRAVDPVERAVHTTSATAPVEINFEVREGGSLKGPIEVAGNMKIIVEFPRTIGEGDTHTYILHYDAQDPNSDLKRYHSQRFSSFRECKYFKWIIEFREKTDKVYRYVHDRVGSKKLEDYGKIPLKNGNKDVFDVSSVDPRIEYVYEWEW